eukprot:CAMPEP_0117573178 /NCGR_PEP_ID=MMETSP0784-20121206/60804_1 /TAXON_ID=39447 /ORGANISM="" /LENGTH=303 /DNA_ID=CAMNT_0005371703 /DNA_START=69 /DNA_END=978 /DNA_ORIENTATION=-
MRQREIILARKGELDRASSAADLKAKTLATLLKSGTLPNIYENGWSSLRRTRSEPTVDPKFYERQFNHRIVRVSKKDATQKRVIIEENRDDMNRYRAGVHGLNGFKAYLAKRFGSVLAGWRALDRDRNGRLSFAEFCAVLRDLDIHGNINGLWKALDSDCSGSVTLMELDAEIGHYVGVFKLELIKRYGSLLAGWFKAIDVNQNGTIDEAEMIEAVERLRLHRGNKKIDARKLYKMFLVGPKSVELTLQMFDPDSWNEWCHKGAFPALPDYESSSEESESEEERPEVIALSKANEEANADDDS